jgi:hypothetical protein
MRSSNLQVVRGKAPSSPCNQRRVCTSSPHLPSSAHAYLGLPRSRSRTPIDGICAKVRIYVSSLGNLIHFHAGYFSTVELPKEQPLSLI